MKLNKIFNIKEIEFRKRGLLNKYSESDIPIFINIEKILSTNIFEFNNSADIISKNFFDTLMAFADLKENIKTNEDKEYYEMTIKSWNLSEQKNGKGYFGLSKNRKDGKAAGFKRKDNLVDSMIYVMKKIIDILKNDNFLKARLFNFTPSTSKYISVDVISDILIILFDENFKSFTKRMIKELEISEKFISKDGLLWINGREEYFYPLEFFTQIPIVDVRAFNAVKQYSSNGFGAFSDLFKKKNDLLRRKIEKISDEEIDFIFELLDFSFLRSLFMDNSEEGIKYSNIKSVLIDGKKIIDIIARNAKKSFDMIESAINEVIKKGIELYSYQFDKDRGWSKINEDFFQKWLFVGLNLIFKNSVSQHNDAFGYGVNDIEISKENNENELIEIKLLKDPARIGKLLENYKNQMIVYNQNKYFKKNYFIIFVADSIEKETIKNLIERLEKVNEEIQENSIINQKFKVVKISRRITGSRAKSNFEPVVQIFEDSSLKNYSDIDNKEIMEINNLKKHYYKISGFTINTVHKDEINEKIKESSMNKNFYIKEIKKCEESHSNDLMSKNENELLQILTKLKKK